VAVGTHHVALLDFSHEAIERGEHSSAGCDAERLRGWIPMVEVHLERCERSATVVARHVAESTKESEGACLAEANTGNLAFAHASVIRHVVGTLIPPLHRY
jgi:hypothetical protein